MIPEIKDKKIKSSYLLLEKAASHREYRSIGLMHAHDLMKEHLGISKEATPDILRCLSKFGLIELVGGQIYVRPMNEGESEGIE